MADDTVTRAEFERVRDIAEAALALAARLAEEHGLRGAIAGLNEIMHPILEKLEERSDLGSDVGLVLESIHRSLPR